MADLIQAVKSLYAAFSRGDAAFIVAQLADDVSWEAEGPEDAAFFGVRRGPAGAMEFFKGIAAEHGDPKLHMTEFVSSGDAVAVFGRYECTFAGKRLDMPLGHFFQFPNGKVVRYINLTNSALFAKAKAASA